MDKARNSEAEMRPRVIQRSCGGWLATSPSNMNLQIGVTAPTESEALNKFVQTLDRWREILAAGRARGDLGHSRPT